MHEQHRYNLTRRFPTFLAFLAIAAGCGGKALDEGGATTASKAKEPATSSPRLGAVLPMFAHPFFIAQRDGLKEEARKSGTTIDVRDGQDDDQKQTVQVEALASQKVDALILCPRDENALIAAVESANRAKVPVVTLNRRVNGGEVVTYVGADDAAGGRAQGEALVEALGPSGGAILYFQGTAGSSPQIAREKGFKEILAKHPEIEIADEVYANFQEDEAKSLMTGLVGQYRPGQIKAIVAQADEMALPAAEVAREAGWNLPVIGFNGTKDAFDAIRAGHLHATILQDASEQGRLAVHAALDHLAGKAVPPEIFTPLPVVTRANVDQLRPAY